MDLHKTISFYFGEPALENVGLSTVAQAAGKYPYCAALQYLLLKKMHDVKDPGYDRQAEKTVLFFPNYHRLYAMVEAPAAPRPEPVAAPVIAEVVQEVEIPEPAAAAPVVEEPGEESTVVEEAAVEEPIIEAATLQEEPPLAEPALRTDLLLKESPIRIPTLKDIQPQTDDLPIFEPYHTIDYFASQGIKLSQDWPSSDKFGRQLKSFTEWVRSMKKLPQAELEREMGDKIQGERIVAMAAGSVQAREVLTETMAEVLVKQGQKSSAIAIYQKLSLAHPDKSAYFAARIEQLKHQ